MSDYIKREDAIEAIASRDETDGTVKVFAGREVNEILSNIPPADVVEVVRCKHCKHRYYDRERDLYYCRMFYGMGDVSDNNYCCLGKRTDE